MYQHIRNVHKVEPTIPGSILCPKCSISVTTYEKLRHHIEAEHSIKIEKEEITFSEKSGMF